MIFLTGEVAFPLDSAIILAFCLIQNDANPLPRGKQSRTNICNCTPLTLPDHLHNRANLEENYQQQVSIHFFGYSYFCFLTFFPLCLR